MKVDNEQLEALAKAATQGTWGSDGRYIAPSRQEDGTTYVESWRALGLMSTAEDARFVAAANPATVLAMLAEIKRLEIVAVAMNGTGVMELISERDQLAAENEALRKDAERYQWLRDQRPNAFHLERNSVNSINYCTVAEWIENNPDWFDDTPADDLAKMAEADTYWQLQIYPHTPVGFHVTARATLDEVIDAARIEEAKP